jgi:hypothetical protein
MASVVVRFPDRSRKLADEQLPEFVGQQPRLTTVSGIPQWGYGTVTAAERDGEWVRLTVDVPCDPDRLGPGEVKQVGPVQHPDQTVGAVARPPVSGGGPQLSAVVPKSGHAPRSSGSAVP